MIKKSLLFLFLFNISNISFSNEILIEYHPQNGYVLVTPQGVSSQHMPKEFITKLKKIHKGKSEIKSMAFTPDGKGWTIVSSNEHETKGVDGGYKSAINKLQSNKYKIKSVAFNPANWQTQHGFVIIHDKGYVAERIPNKLKEQLDHFARQTQELKSVEFTPDGGWTVISKNQEWSRMIQGKQVKSNFIDNLRASYLDGKQTQAVSFNPDKYSTLFGWLLITDKGYDGMNIPEVLKQHLSKSSIQNFHH